jgi:hypothetical protein
LLLRGRGGENNGVAIRRKLAAAMPVKKADGRKHMMMKRPVVALAIGALSILAPSLCEAKKPESTPLLFKARADGELAEKLVLQVRAAAGRSARFTNPYKNEARYSLYVTAKDIPPGDGTLTGFSYVIAYAPLFPRNPDLEILVSFNTGVCGSNQVPACAEAILLGAYRGIKIFSGPADDAQIDDVTWLKEAAEDAAGGVGGDSGGEH